MGQATSKIPLGLPNADKRYHAHLHGRLFRGRYFRNRPQYLQFRPQQQRHHLALDVYKPFRQGSDDDTIIQRSKKIGVAMAVITMTIAPFIMYFPEGIFTFMVVGAIRGSDTMVLLLGYFSRKTPPFAANLCLGIF